MKSCFKFFSFFSVLIIVLCLSSVTAFAADETNYEMNDKGYPALTDDPQDGDVKWRLAARWFIRFISRGRL